MSDDCIFCKIVSGQLPSAKVYEDEDALAFLDLFPVEKGHVLVIPKQHCERLTETPVALLRKLISAVRRVAIGQARALRTDGVNVTQANGASAGQVVPHVHFHLIPRWAASPARNWNPGKYDDPAEMQRLAASIRAAVKPGPYASM
jgi:histidine triad (HIT) family protein